MKPRTQLRYLSIALFALWGRAGAESLPPFEVPASLLGRPATRQRPVKAVEAAPAPADMPAPAAPVPSAVAPAATPLPAPVAPQQPATPRPGAAPAAVAPKAPAPVRSAPAVKTGVTVITGDRVFGHQDLDAVAEGRAVLQRDGTTVEGDTLQYFELSDEVDASGNVRLLRGGDVMSGPHARMKVQEQVGVFDTPSYSISRPPRAQLPGEQAGARQQPFSGHGSADSLQLEGENQFHFFNATWTSCKPDRPDWYVRARELQLDYDRDVGEATRGTLVFKDVPLLYMPWADFPLAEQRQSGFLAPSFGTSNKVGFDLSVPYYWNIAPNYDSTITPRYMGRRGLQLRDEVRYLTATSKGTSYIEYMPDDQVAQRSRIGGSIQHNENFGSGWRGNINYSGVSDPAYFTDLSSRLALTSQVNLLRQADVSYSGGGWWSMTGALQSYQTLNDPSSGTRVGEPYKRLPQLTLVASRPELPGGLAFNLNSEFVSFSNSNPTLDQGRRLTVYPQLSLPVQTSSFYVTPKIGVHATRYDLDRRSSDVIGGPDTVTRTLPIASLDTGVTFERETTYAGKDYIQTLEPRIYYLYVPNRDQSHIPVFDSGVYDFNFAQIFADNVFTGGDRISNANQVTSAVQTRLISPDNGAELMRAALGQRYYFEDQRVFLDYTNTTAVPTHAGGKADLLAAFSGQIAPKTQFDTGWQYNPRDDRTERFNVGMRYTPGFARVINTSWRYRRNYSTDPTAPDGFRDLDVTGQWPLWGNWYGVGRYNRNLRDHRLTEGIAGFEYNAGCWVLRTVVQRLATTSTDTTRSFFIQLEFSGLASLGSSPLNALRRSVPGYGKISDTGNNPFLGGQEY